MRALRNLVTDQNHGRKDKSTENEVVKDFFPNCCRNVTIRDNSLKIELRWGDTDEGRDAQNRSSSVTLEQSLRHAMMWVAGRVIAL